MLFLFVPAAALSAVVTPYNATSVAIFFLPFHCIVVVELLLLLLLLLLLPLLLLMSLPSVKRFQ